MARAQGMCVQVFHNRLKKIQIRDGFKLAYSHGSLCFPIDLIEMIVDFAV